MASLHHCKLLPLRLTGTDNSQWLLRVKGATVPICYAPSDRQREKEIWF